MVFFLMIRRPQRSTRTASLFPYTTLFRSAFYVDLHTSAGEVRGQRDRSALLSTSLSGGANVPVGDPDGAGEAYLDLVGDGLVCLRLNIRSVGRPTAAQDRKSRRLNSSH